MKLSGVYRLVNLKTGWIYWGCSESGIGRKRKQHYKRLRTGNHPNKKLQQDWNTFGPDAFRFEVWERTAPERARERKEYHMLLHANEHPDIAVYNERHACRNKAVHAAPFGPPPRLEDIPALGTTPDGVLKAV